MEVGIIGSGIIGLASALALAEAGYSVKVVARELPGDESQNWASPWAGAGILPYPEGKGHDLQINTFKYYWALAHRDPTSGVQVVDVTEYFDDREDDSAIWYKRLVPKYHVLDAKELPEKAKLGVRYQSMTVNPAVFLPWIQSILIDKGVRFYRAEVKSIDEARSTLKTQIIVNASGLGALDIAADKAVVPVRGQTLHVKSNSHEIVMFQGSHYTYQIPRMYSGGVVIGGVSQEGSRDQKADAVTRADIIQRFKLLTRGRSDYSDPQNHIQDIVAFRPARKGGYRLEREGSVIHAYGFNTLGYTYSYGVGLRVKELVDLILGRSKQPTSRL
ncbi:FAD dependent oxidoreductase, putative [Paecilomyces variotii No. 5]|uniref:FAD dependent oxidoreductase, putative n=1 Tax=Byssochlamys spectabilis (strain No. 5 / NBRC 109023) TaxID=1356009 RepID=V5FKN1_BYSSN|nr:FAD dependent oxidoreductase, putative [Paecilomyces variotii No. 5]